MRRVFLALGVACALVCAASLSALASTIAPGKATLRGRGNVCQKAVDQGAREISVTAVMRPIRGTAQMQLKVVLLTRTPGAPGFTVQPGPGLGDWVTPKNPSLGTRPQDIWVLHHPVYGLSAPALYRFQVSFRWIGAHHRVLGTVVRNGPKCVQPELRPDLQVQGVTVTANAKGTKDRYDATVYNGGRTAAGPFIVDFRYQDPSTEAPVVASENVPGLSSHRSVVLEWVGPICSPSAPPTVDVDPDDQVPDYNPANNTYQVVCPS